MNTLVTGAIAATLSLLATSGPAQGRVWIVDRANGPGTDFLDLPPAEAAAADGDVMWVRGGTYTGIRTSKALALIGIGGVTLAAQNVTDPVLAIHDLAAGKTFVVRDVVLDTSALASEASVRNCRGTVILHDVQSRSYSPVIGSSLQVWNSAAVLLQGCGTTSSRFTVIAIGSTIAVAGCVLRGQDAAYTPLENRFAMPGMSMTSGSTAWLADTALTGGDGTLGWPNMVYRTSAPGLSMSTSHAYIGVGCTIATGTGATTTLPVSAIADSGDVAIDPAVPLSPWAAAPPIALAIAVTTRPLASLTAGGGVLGGNLVVGLRCRPGAVYALAAGFVQAPLATPLGGLFLAPAGLLVFAVGAQGGSGLAQLTVPLPADARFRGLHLGVQGIVAVGAGGAELTGPAAVALR